MGDVKGGDGTSSIRSPPPRPTVPDHRGHSPRIPPVYQQRELPKAEPTVAGLSTLVDAPRLDDINPTAHQLLVALCDKVKETPAHDVRRANDAVV